MKRGLDTLLLAAGLFSLSCAVLCYNLVTLHSDELEATLTAAAETPLSQAAAAVIGSAEADALEADAKPIELHEYELLPPIVAPS